MNETGPQTLIEAVRHFSDLQLCFRYMVAIKWPDGKPVCPKCGSDKIGIIATRSVLQCKDKGCRKQFSAKVGTIFEDSPLGLDKWFVAVWCIANAKNGISSCEVSRALGVTQKTAWFMMHRVRLAMQTETFRKLCGEVESDETFVGGKAANMHADERETRIRGRGPVGKAIVHGLLERGNAEEGTVSQVRATVVPNTEAETLVPEIVRNVEPGTPVFTDAASSYGTLSDRDFVHRFVDHATRYVVGRVHVNGLENFWSLLKRGLKGTYVAVRPYHLFRYVDEQVFRFNERKRNDGERFAHVMQAVAGKRITYRRLCAIGFSGFMGLP
jgi:transposase-like protein